MRVRSPLAWMCLPAAASAGGSPFETAAAYRSWNTVHLPSRLVVGVQSANALRMYDPVGRETMDVAMIRLYRLIKP